jgi:hypothetical protein
MALPTAPNPALTLPRLPPPPLLAPLLLALLRPLRRPMLTTIRIITHTTKAQQHLVDLRQARPLHSQRLRLHNSLNPPRYHSCYLFIARIFITSYVCSLFVIVLHLTTTKCSQYCFFLSVSVEAFLSVISVAFIIIGTKERGINRRLASFISKPTHNFLFSFGDDN